MAALAHVGVGLAAKKFAPKVPVWVLVVTAVGIDLVWAVFYFAGLESLPTREQAATSPWSHSLGMALLWSGLAGLAAGAVGRSPRLRAHLGSVTSTRLSLRTGVLIGLLFFSHWVVDFISHPMTVLYPAARGLPVLFADGPLLGLGLYRTSWGLNLGEYGTLALGLLIYLLTLRDLRRQKSAPAYQQ